jgi:hypothetical protein
MIRYRDTVCIYVLCRAFVRPHGDQLGTVLIESLESQIPRRLVRWIPHASTSYLVDYID